MNTPKNRDIRITYTNHRGEKNTRRITPERIRFGTSPHHQGEQWFMEAIDRDKGVSRSFALTGIPGIEPDQEEQT